MNVSKKIKMFPFLNHKMMLIFAILVSSNAFAQNPQNPSYTVSGQDHLTPGYVSLLMDYNNVQQQMQNAITQGQAATWRQWMDAGVKKNQTLYWWTLANWLYATNKKDDAYKALMQAFVFMKVEMATCGGHSPTGMAMINEMLERHKYIVVEPHSQQTLKSSVLEAVTRVENTLNRGEVLPKMSCDWMQVRKHNKAQSKKLPLSSPERDKKLLERELDAQRTALKKIKQELSYEKMWTSSDSSIIWNLQNL